MRRIEKFKKGIEIKKNHIYVDFLWNDNINQVSSYCEVCLAILDTVYRKLNRDNPEKEYNDVFCEL